MSHKEPKYDLDDLLQQLRRATNDFADAERAESEARSRTTDARNRINTIQKEIDEVMAELRKSAPRDSKWADESRRPAGV